MQTFSKIWIAGAVLSLCACSGSSTNLPAGVQCGEGYKPLPITAAPGQKVVNQDPKKNAEDKIMPPGKYVYKFADVIYTQNAVDKPVIIDARDNAATGKQTMTCARNASNLATLKPVNFEADAVTDVIVCPDYSQVVKTRRFKMTIVNRVVTMGTPIVNQQCLDSSIGVYPKGPSIILKNNAVDYEIRNEQKADDQSATFSVGVHLTYVNYGNQVPAECANKCVSTQPDPSAEPPVPSTN